MDATYRRRYDGQSTALRDARRARRWTMQELAAATRESDPAGKGVGFQLISLLESGKSYGRENTTQRTAELLEDTLGVPRGSLFTEIDTPHVVPLSGADLSWESL